jgi:putative transposase
MSAHQAEFPIATMARVLGVSPSGYYAWRSRPTSAHATADAALLRRIRTIHAASHGTYGAPRVHAELQAEGTAVARKRVARLMRGAGLRGVSRRRFPTTTQREPRHRPANDLVGRDFRAAGPNRLWVADITYVPTGRGSCSWLSCWTPGRAALSAGPWRRTCAPASCWTRSTWR